MSDKQILYEIYFTSHGKEYPIKNYLYSFHMFRDDVVSLNRDKIENTLRHLKSAYACDDMAFEIREVLPTTN